MTSLIAQLILVACLISPFGVIADEVAGATDKATIAKDPILEKRLVTQSIYKSRRGDTLKRVALFLYGHQTWTVKIKEDNEFLSGYSDTQAIPANTEISYRAPIVGSTYKVQENDWLVRIVQWKYGSLKDWEKIYQKNAQRISNPNLIRPGDELTLAVDGTVRKANSGQVLVEGVANDTAANANSVPPPNVPEHQEVAVTMDTANASLNSRDPASEPFFGDANPFALGFGVGVFVLLLLTTWYWYTHHRAIAYDIPELEFSLPKEGEKVKGGGKSRSKAKGSPKAIRKVSMADIEMDKSLIHRDQGELEGPTGYDLITSTTRKKPLKIKGRR